MKKASTESQATPLLYLKTSGNHKICTMFIGLLYCQEEISAHSCNHLHTLNLGQNFPSSSMANQR